jgi:hypothetical protein
MSLLAIVRYLDEFAVNEFIVNPSSVSYAEGLSTWSLISTAMLVFTIMAVIMGLVSDKLGRRPACILLTILFVKETKHYALLFQLEVRYEDGSNETFISDEGVYCSDAGPVRFSDLFCGETRTDPVRTKDHDFSQG